MNSQQNKPATDEAPPTPGPTYCALPLYQELEDTLASLKKAFVNCSDVIYRPFCLFDNRAACLLYLQGGDSHSVDADILAPLTMKPAGHDAGPLSLDDIQRTYIHIADATRRTTLQDIVSDVMAFRVVLLIAFEREALSLNAMKYPQRAIAEPETESVIRGPHAGFTEDLDTNVVQVRRKLHTPDLKIEYMELGSYSHTKVAILYLEGVVNPNLVTEVRERLGRIQIDGILESGYIEELIEDTPYSPFPQIQNTERPDVVASLLLEGRFALLIDGTPLALMAPINLWGAMASPEDYYERFFITNLLRWIRYLFLFVALFLPSIYIAVTTFNQEVLPTNLLLSIAAARENTPFPALVEAFSMEITFEALREAGVRLPKTVGQAVSIVGALVIGQAAVQAGIISAPMVIVVSVTGIASFCIPRFNFAISIRLLRFPMMILAGTLGAFGIFMGSLVILAHLCALRSFGSPYLMPLAPFSASGLKDTVVRVPWWAMRSRPYQTSKINIARQPQSTTPKQRLPRPSRQNNQGGA